MCSIQALIYLDDSSRYFYLELLILSEYIPTNFIHVPWGRTGQPPMKSVFVSFATTSFPWHLLIFCGEEIDLSLKVSSVRFLRLVNDILPVYTVGQAIQFYLVKLLKYGFWLGLLDSFIADTISHVCDQESHARDFQTSCYTTLVTSYITDLHVIPYLSSIDFVH